MHLTLFSTDHCALCDRALDVLLGLPELRGHVLDVVDVADNAQLLEHYGPRLPVLRAGTQEIAWPFSGADVLRLVQAD